MIQSPSSPSSVLGVMLYVLGIHSSRPRARHVVDASLDTSTHALYYIIGTRLYILPHLPRRSPRYGRYRPTRSAMSQRNAILLNIYPRAEHPTDAFEASQRGTEVKARRHQARSRHTTTFNTVMIPTYNLGPRLRKGNLLPLGGHDAGILLLLEFFLRLPGRVQSLLPGAPAMPASSSPCMNPLRPRMPWRGASRERFASGSSGAGQCTAVRRRRARVESASTLVARAIRLALERLLMLLPWVVLLLVLNVVRVCPVLLLPDGSAGTLSTSVLPWLVGRRSFAIADV